MSLKSARIVKFGTVYGFAEMDGEKKQIFLHTCRLVHPYGTKDGVRFYRSDKPTSYHSTILVKIEVYKGGLRAREWMCEREYIKAKQHSKDLREKANRGKSPQRLPRVQQNYQ